MLTGMRCEMFTVIIRPFFGLGLVFRRIVVLGTAETTPTSFTEQRNAYMFCVRL